MTKSFGSAALVWVVLVSGIAHVVESSRLNEYTTWRATEGRQPLLAYPHDGSHGRSLKDVASSNDLAACGYLPDTMSSCVGAVDLCDLDDELGEYFRRACQTTCKICTVRPSGSPTVCFDVEPFISLGHIF